VETCGEGRLVDFNEVTELLKLSSTDVTWLVDTGQLSPIRICGQTRYDRRDIERLIEFYKRVQHQRRPLNAREDPNLPGR
jgi:hypothetical protein